MMTIADIDLAPKKVAVTGASGFIGRYLVRALIERGAQVVAVVRTPAKLGALRDRVEVRCADLRDRAALTEALSGCDVLLANAGLVSIGGAGRAQLIATNLDGTRNTLHAAAAAGIEHVVLTSSALVYRPKWSRRYSEGDPLRHQDDRTTRLGWYALSKACGEREAWRLSAQLGIPLSTVRPYVVYGADDGVGFTLWLRRFLRPPGITAFPRGLRLPAIYAGDLAEAVCCILERSATRGRAYNLAGREPVDFWQLLAAYRNAGGDSPAVVLPLPVPFSVHMDVTRAHQELQWSVRPHEDAFTELLAIERATP